MVRPDRSLLRRPSRRGIRLRVHQPQPLRPVFRHTAPLCSPCDSTALLSSRYGIKASRPAEMHVLREGYLVEGNEGMNAANTYNASSIHCLDVDADADATSSWWMLARLVWRRMTLCRESGTSATCDARRGPVQTKDNQRLLVTHEQRCRCRQQKLGIPMPLCAAVCVPDDMSNNKELPLRWPNTAAKNAERARCVVASASLIRDLLAEDNPIGKVGWSLIDDKVDEGGRCLWRLTGTVASIVVCLHYTPDSSATSIITKLTDPWRSYTHTTMARSTAGRHQKTLRIISVERRRTGRRVP